MLIKKVFKSIFICGVFMLVFFSLKTFAVANLIDVDFENKTLNSPLKTYINPYTPDTNNSIDTSFVESNGNKCIEFKIDSTTGANQYAQLYGTSRPAYYSSGNIEFSFDFKADSNSSLTKNYVDCNFDNMSLGIRFDYINKAIKNTTNNVAFANTSGLDLEFDVWQNIKIEFDTVNEIFNIYIDMVKVNEQPISVTYSNPEGIDFKNLTIFGSSGTKNYVDKINLKNYDSFYGGPIEITAGGTYTGNWESKTNSDPAIKISTTSPVTIINSNVRSKGDLIKNTIQNTNITVKNTNGYALNPGLDNYNGKFMYISYPKNVICENNYIEGCLTGVLIHGFNGNGSSSETIRIKYNKIKNTDGRKSDGIGYYSNDWSNNCTIQLVYVKNISNIEISWNEIINIPYNCSVGDIINIYDSRGTVSSYINIHDNYIEGGYRADPFIANDGLGVIVDGHATISSDAPSYVNIYNNQVVNTTGGGVGVTIGSNVNLYSNKTVYCGELPSDGSENLSLGKGMGVLSYQQKSEEYLDGTTINIYNNISGWWAQKLDGTVFRQDYYTPIGICTNNSSIQGEITRSTEIAEYTSWQNKVNTTGVKIGVNIGCTQSFETSPYKSSDVTAIDGEYALKAPGTYVDNYYTLPLGITEVWFYDTMNTQQYNYIYFQDLTFTYTRLYVGVNTSVNQNYYCLRDVLSSSGWGSTTVSRSLGWHKLVFDYSMQNYRRIILDETVIYESTAPHIGNHVTRIDGDADKMYFDYIRSYLTPIGANSSLESFETNYYKYAQPVLDGYYSLRKSVSDDVYNSFYSAKSYGKTEAWFYDMMEPSTQSYIFFNDEINQYTELYVGVNTLTSTNRYSYRDAKVGDWIVTSILRTPGWHCVVFDYSYENNRELFIDGKLIWSSNSNHSGNYITRVGGNVNSNYFDRFITYDPLGTL